MKFTKMEGIGNDYVYVNLFEETVEHPAETAVKVSDRHFGIGSDGLILIGPSQTADCRMRIFNADGSEGEMCGNGIRCVGKYVYDHGLVRKETMTVETGGGIRQLRLTAENGRVSLVTVDMGKPELTSELPEPIRVHGTEYEFTGISMRNPHAVYVMPEIDSLDLEKIGPGFETHPRFPDRVNSEFIRILDRSHIQMRVWERGSGETWACGTGACASAAAAMLLGLTDTDVDVCLRGGHLRIVKESDGRLFMTGPAREVFRGEIDLECP